MLDSILYIDPILKRDEIDGLIIEKKRICDDFVKKYILIGEPNKQEKLLEFFENLRNHDDSGTLDDFRTPDPQPLA